MISHAPAAARRPQSSVAIQAAAADAFDRMFLLDSPGTTEIVMVRHGEPDFRTAIKTGNPDTPLTERGRCQAMRLAMRLRAERIDAIYTSTARAALETAAVVAAAKDLPMIRAPQLAGVACNDNVILKAADHQKLVAEMSVRFMNNPRWDAIRTFEPSRQFRHRAIQTVEAIVSRHAGERVVLVTTRL